MEWISDLNIKIRGIQVQDICHELQTLREGTMDTIHNEGKQIAFAVGGKAVVTQGVDIQHHTGGVGVFQTGKAELCFCVIEIDVLKFQRFQDAEKSIGIAGEMHELNKELLGQTDG